MEKCIQKVTHTRGVSLCYICSSNSPHYFFKQKAIVRPALCSFYLQDCVNPIIRILGMIDEMNLVINFTKAHLYHIYQYATNTTQENTILSLREKLFSNKEFKLLTNYIRARDKETKKQLLNKVCSLLVSLSHKTFIQNISTGLKNYIYGLRNVIHKLQSSVNKKNYESNRILFTDNSSANDSFVDANNSHDLEQPLNIPPAEVNPMPISEDRLLVTRVEGDVVVFTPSKQDSAYTFFGDNSISNNEHYFQFQPMPINLTKSFP
jgi:hypothetical protein